MKATISAGFKTEGYRYTDSRSVSLTVIPIDDGFNVGAVVDLGDAEGTDLRGESIILDAEMCREIGTRLLAIAEEIEARE